MKYIIKNLIVIVLIFISGAFMSFIERRALGLWQDRYGPNRVGYFGLFQFLADVIKIIFKEDWIPPFSDNILFFLSPIISLITIILSFIILPFNNETDINNVGILFFLAMGGINVYSILFSGYSSCNKYALIGAIRASAQSISYEVFIGLSLMGIVSISGSFNIINIIEYQKVHFWFLMSQTIGFITFFISGICLTHRHPFDQPEAEQELSDGYHIEYSGMKWGMFFISEYVNIIFISILIVNFFFGGYYIGSSLYLLFLFIIKTFFFIILFLIIRASQPRPKYYQVMKFGWQYCLPLNLINLLLTGIIILLYNT
ncbi:NADH-ubiquinone oxidoreductase chain H [Candidatus Portiera aleyrodidarum]|uniref:NADH-quinone oxidoreductase subunit H n=1 Tax=Candidatus Portiera aleyrodidarum TaxID=91844 RepID=A0A6S6RVN4_9GAMM|nr:NADH-quinone oxidoreductase subunit NuoH [Candidatus Portiera aleyrodidarum]CAA3704377.1 NADH-ubiquinone oxidoreductase chain H [Candidatus Portiera aleyrodidarum]